MREQDFRVSNRRNNDMGWNEDHTTWNKDHTKMTISFTKEEEENFKKHTHENLTPKEFQDLKNRIQVTPRDDITVYIPENKMIIIGRNEDRSMNDIYHLNFGQYVSVCKMLGVD
jgi:hypothetical protein